MKPLNQEDFAMEIVEDLGVICPKATSKAAVRTAVFKCTKCGKQFKTNAYSARAKQQKYCASCSNSVNQTRREVTQDKLECTTCGEFKPFSAFYRQKGTATGFRTQCKECTLIQNKEYRDNNKDSIKVTKKKSYVSKNYNISLEEYESRFKENPVCQICGSSAEESSMPTLNYDHCHTTGKFRGILCRNCNQALGLLGDTADRLKIAYEYLLEAECH